MKARSVAALLLLISLAVAMFSPSTAAAPSTMATSIETGRPTASEGVPQSLTFPYRWCFQGSAVGTGTFWTPVLMINSPFMGSASGTAGVSDYSTYTFTAAGLTMTSTTTSAASSNLPAYDGASEGYFELDDWTVYNTVTTWIYAWGNDWPCDKPYIAAITYQYGCYIGRDLQGIYPSNTQQVTSFTATSTCGTYPSITFNNNFAPSAVSIGTCDLSVPLTETITDTTFSATGVSVSISVGYIVTVNGILSFTWLQGQGSTTSYTYTFPAHGGNWYYYNLNGGGAGLHDALAFDWAPCAPTWSGEPDARDGIFTLSWTPQNPGSAVASYVIEGSANGGPWTVLGTSTQTSFTVPYQSGGSHQYRIRAVDSTGRVGSPSPAPTFQVPWDTRLTTSNTATSSRPAIAVDPSGNYNIVWVDNRDGNNEIYYKKMDPNWNTLVSETRLTTDSYDSISPAMVVAPSGIITVVWADNRYNGNYGHHYDVYKKQYTTGWGADTMITTDGTLAWDTKEPDVAVDVEYGTEVLYYTWRVVQRTPYSEDEMVYWTPIEGAEYLVYTMSGAPFSDPHNDRILQPRIALGATGVAHIVFSVGPAYPVERGTSYMDYYRPTGGLFLTLGTNGDAARPMSIDADTAGHVYVAWSYYSNGFDIAFRKSDNGGSNWASEIDFGTGSSSNQYYPDVSVGSGSKVYVVWMDNSAAQYDLYWVVSTSYGNSGYWSSPAQLTNAAGDSVNARIATNPSYGEPGVVWQDHRDGNWRIYFTAKWF